MDILDSPIGFIKCKLFIIILRLCFSDALDLISLYNFSLEY